MFQKQELEKEKNCIVILNFLTKIRQIKLKTNILK